MKTAIFTLSIGDHDKYLPTMLSAKMYAEKYGIPYFVADQLEIRFVGIPFEKFQCFKLFDVGYDRVLMLDRDILITTNAPNIFECYPDMDTLYAFEENAPTEQMNRDPIVNAIKAGIDWPKNEKGLYKYFNTGVALLSKNFKDSIAGYRDVPDIPEMWRFFDQTCINYLVFKKGVKFESIDYSWNRMHLGLPDPKNKRYEANFIHYAGPCAYGDGGDKYETIRKDFIHFYGENTLKLEETRIAHPRQVEESTDAGAETPQVGSSNKKCSIVFLTAENPSVVNSYLRYLPAEQLPADYELLFINGCLPQIDPAYSEAIKASTKIITLIPGLEFDRLCIETARQAQGEYVLFVNNPTSKEQVITAVQQLEGSGMNVGIDSGKNYIIVKRLPFLKAGGFPDRENEQQQETQKQRVSNQTEQKGAFPGL